MKNAFLSLLLATSLALFFSFNPHSRITATDEENFFAPEDGITAPDTVPKKKVTPRPKSKTEPYDSFGKPKKMDSALSRR